MGTERRTVNANPNPRHARLTRSQVRADISPVAKVILAAIAYLLKVGETRVLSHRTIARQARVSPGSVSRLLPVLAAEPGNEAGNEVPFVQIEQADGMRVITLLDSPEKRGWYRWADAPQVGSPDEPKPSGGAQFTPIADACEGDGPVLLLADQLDFLVQLDFFSPHERSVADQHLEATVQPVQMPQTDEETRSMTDRPIFLVHMNQLLAYSSSEPMQIAPPTAASQPLESIESRSETPTPVPPPPAPVPPSPTPVPPPPAPVPPSPTPKTVPTADEVLRGLRERGIYPGLAYRVVQTHPELTLLQFDRLSSIVAGRSQTRHPAAIVTASILARGETIDEAQPTAIAPLSEHVSAAEILHASLDAQERGVWIGRFRQAVTAAEKHAILERFRREIGGRVA